METNWICKEDEKREWDAQERKERQHEEMDPDTGTTLSPNVTALARSASESEPHTYPERPEIQREKRKARQKQEKARTDRGARPPSDEGIMWCSVSVARSKTHLLTEKQDHVVHLNSQAGAQARADATWGIRAAVATWRARDWKKLNYIAIGSRHLQTPVTWSVV